MTRSYILAKPLPAPLRALPHLLRGACLFLIAVGVTSCIGPQGMVMAKNVKPAIDQITERHDAMLRGELDPSTLGQSDPAAAEILRKNWLRTSATLRDVVDTAAKQSVEVTPPIGN